MQMQMYVKSDDTWKPVAELSGSVTLTPPEDKPDNIMAQPFNPFQTEVLTGKLISVDTSAWVDCSSNATISVSTKFSDEIQALKDKNTELENKIAQLEGICRVLITEMET